MSLLFKKVIALTFLLFGISLFSFSQTEDSSVDLDSMFEDAEDVTEAVVADTSSQNSFTIKTSNFLIPLNFSGHMEAELGAGYVRENQNNNGTGGVDFLNDLTFSAIADQTLSFKATLRSEFPNDEDTHISFSLYEMYFDYVLFNRVYITAGKKNTSWGCIRLFSDTDNYEDDDDALYTNILTDSNDGISGQVRIPFGNSMLTGFALYKGTDDEDVSFSNLSFAAALELVAGYTSFNFFARKFPSSNSAVVLAGDDVYKDSIIGAEVKRTILGFDIYAQELALLGDYTLLKELGKTMGKNNQIHSDDLAGFSKMVFTGGLYRLWQTQGPALGFNAEFQDVYVPVEHEHTSKIAFYGGILKLGKGKNTNLGVTWKHSFQEEIGEVEPGVIFTGILPHATWKNGVKVEYGGEYDNPAKITLASSIKITLDY